MYATKAEIDEIWVRKGITIEERDREVCAAIERMAPDDPLRPHFREWAAKCRADARADGEAWAQSDGVDVAAGLRVPGVK